jgi:hypothetical protein
MKEISDILSALIDEPSINGKVKILTEEKDNTLLKKVLIAAYDPTINYWIKSIPTYSTGVRLYPLGQAISMLDDLADRRVTGNAAIKYLAHILESVSASDAMIIECVITRDLRGGFGSKLINRVWKNLIFEYGVMKCSSNISGIKYPAYAQEKGDGARMHMYYDGKRVLAFSRNGKPITTHGVFDESAKSFMLAGETYDGELLFYRNGVCLDRKTGNGLATKAIRGTISAEEAADMVFMTWGKVDFTSTIKYSDIMDKLKADNIVGNIIRCPTEIVNSEIEAIEFFTKMRKSGKEGAIIKNFDLVWEDKRVKGAGKIKDELEGELRIVDLIPGTGKYSGMLGAIVGESLSEAGKKVLVSVGSGFSDEQRKESFTIGQIFTVRYNEAISSKSKDTCSLFLPRFIEIRLDKDEPDTFSYFMGK